MRLYCSFQELYNSEIFVQTCNFELWKVNTCSSRLLWGLGSADSCNPPPSDEIARNARNSRQKIFEQKNMDETALQTWLLVIGWAGSKPPPPQQLSHHYAIFLYSLKYIADSLNSWATTTTSDAELLSRLKKGLFCIFFAFVGLVCPATVCTQIIVKYLQRFCWRFLLNTFKSLTFHFVFFCTWCC